MHSESGAAHHLDGAFEELLLYAELGRALDSGRLPETVQSFGETLHIRQALRDCGSFNAFKELITCKGKRSLIEMLRCFERFLPVVRGNTDLIEELAFRFVEKQAAQHVVYTELKYSPHLLSNAGTMEAQEGGGGGGEGASAAEAGAVREARLVFAAVTRGLRRGEARFGVTVNQILCCLSFQLAWAADVVELAIEHHRRRRRPLRRGRRGRAVGEDWLDEASLPTRRTGTPSRRRGGRGSP